MNLLGLKYSTSEFRKKLANIFRLASFNIDNTGPVITVTNENRNMKVMSESTLQALSNILTDVRDMEKMFDALNLSPTFYTLWDSCEDAQRGTFEQQWGLTAICRLIDLLFDNIYIMNYQILEQDLSNELLPENEYFEQSDTSSPFLGGYVNMVHNRLFDGRTVVQGNPSLERIIDAFVTELNQPQHMDGLSYNGMPSVYQDGKYLLLFLQQLVKILTELQHFDKPLYDAIHCAKRQLINSHKDFETRYGYLRPIPYDTVDIWANEPCIIHYITEDGIDAEIQSRIAFFAGLSFEGDKMFYVSNNKLADKYNPIDGGYYAMWQLEFLNPESIYEKECEF